MSSASRWILLLHLWSLSWWMATAGHRSLKLETWVSFLAPLCPSVLLHLQPKTIRMGQPFVAVVLESVLSIGKVEWLSSLPWKAEGYTHYSVLERPTIRLHLLYETSGFQTMLRSVPEVCRIASGSNRWRVQQMSFFFHWMTTIILLI